MLDIMLDPEDTAWNKMSLCHPGAGSLVRKTEELTLNCVMKYFSGEKGRKAISARGAYKKHRRVWKEVDEFRKLQVMVEIMWNALKRIQ